MTLEDFGLAHGDEVRFRRTEGADWIRGSAHSVERDGSIGLYSKSKFRAVYPSQLEVKRRGPRGGTLWIPLKTD